jgi:hypothetical protein
MLRRTVRRKGEDMKRLLVLLAGVLVVVGAYQAWARPVRGWSPEELYEKSEVVVIGVVTEVKDTGKSSSIQLGSNPPHPVKIHRARLKVVQTEKGQPAREIVLEFATLDYEKIKGIVNGPIRIRVERARIYRMYLKKKNKNIFVGALDGAYDDGMAIKNLKLMPSEQPYEK